MRSDSTTLTIAHRLATIRRADWIIVLSSQGDVAEQGTYAQLTRKKDGAFNTLMKMQMEGVTQPTPEETSGAIHEEAEKEAKLEAEMKEAEERRLETERVEREKEREERDKELELREKEKAVAETQL
jgi:putative ABC transport system ATP-binding protein